MGRNRKRVVLAGIAAAAVGSGTSAAWAALNAPAASTKTAVTVTATEFKFKLTKTTVPKGPVAFMVVNKGKQVHDFKVNGKTPKSKFLTAGKKQTVLITFTKAGRYKYLCTVDAHAQLGMRGTLVVK